MPVVFVAVIKPFLFIYYRSISLRYNKVVRVVLCNLIFYVKFEIIVKNKFKNSTLCDVFYNILQNGRLLYRTVRPYPLRLARWAEGQRSTNCQTCDSYVGVVYTNRRTARDVIVTYHARVS